MRQALHHYLADFIRMFSGGHVIALTKIKWIAAAGAVYPPGWWQVRWPVVDGRAANEPQQCNNNKGLHLFADLIAAAAPGAVKYGQKEARCWRETATGV